MPEEIKNKMKEIPEDWSEYLRKAIEERNGTFAKYAQEAFHISRKCSLPFGILGHYHICSYGKFDK